MQLTNHGSPNVRGTVPPTTRRARSFGWFSVGMALALAGAGIIAGVRAEAAPDANEATFVPIEPCRLVDTRPAFNVGPRSSPLAADDTYVARVTGDNGNCVIPTDATGVALNVTAVNPTAPSFMTIYPADAPLPDVSNLNYLPGSYATPNKVDVKLSPNGEVGLFNKYGSVHVIADVSGYYTTSGIQDIVAELDLKASAADVYTKTEIDALLGVVTVADGCDGIQAALDGLPAHGGEVVVGAGAYECDEPIVIDRDHVTLRGSGPSTTLVLADGANSPLLIVGDPSDAPAVVHHHVVVSNLRLEGNSATQPDECWGGPCGGVNSSPIRNNTMTIRKATDVLVEDVIARDARSGGLVIERGCRRITVRGFESSDHVFDGLAAYLTEDSTFTGLMLHDNAYAGLSFDTDFDNNVVTDVVITGSGTDGIFMRDSHDNVFSGLQIRDSTGNGVFIAQDGSDSSTAATGNTFDGLLIAGSGADGMHIANPSNVDNLVDDVQFADNAGGCLVTAAPVVLGENYCR